MLLTRTELVSEGDIGRYAWSRLRRFHDVPYVADVIRRLQNPPPKKKENVKKQATQIRYCLQQAEEYYEAAKAVSLATRPNLLYYSIMSLALAEVLLKQTGDSSLDKARAEHSHHGLVATFGPSGDTTKLKVVAASMRAAPMMTSKDIRRGTFHLWHQSARELPLTGTIHRERISQYRALFIAEDVRLPELPTKGISLLECLQCLPSLMGVISAEDVVPSIVRGVAEVTAHDKDSNALIALHPAPPAVWQEFYGRITVAPKDFESVSMDEQSNCGTLRINTQNVGISIKLPPCAMVGHDQIRFWIKDVCLNEFGFYYVALFIMGNYARYYPDKWIRDVERSTPLSHVVDELMVAAEVRAPLLALSELSRVYLIPGQMS